MYSSCEDDGLPSVLVSADEWHVVDDVVHDSGNAGDVDEQHSHEPHQPVSPQPPQFGVDEHSESHDADEAEEHEDHGLERGFVVDVVSRPLVGEVQHLVGCDVSIRVGNGPLELLQVEFLLDFGDEWHFGLRHDQVGDGLESELR